MIKHHHENRMVDTTVVDDVLCNKCGKSIFLNMVDEDGVPYFSGIPIRQRWGYESKKDGVETIAHICEECYDEFASSFSIPQVTIDWMMQTGPFPEPTHVLPNGFVQGGQEDRATWWTCSRCHFTGPLVGTREDGAHGCMGSCGGITPNPSCTWKSDAER
jgi:hypothetical protein